MDEREERVVKTRSTAGTQQNKTRKAPTQDCRRTRGYKDGFESHTAV